MRNPPNLCKEEPFWEQNSGTLANGDLLFVIGHPPSRSC